MSDRTGRLDVQPGEEIDRQTPLSFTWDGRPYRASRATPSRLKLVAAGVGVFSASSTTAPRGS